MSAGWYLEYLTAVPIANPGRNVLPQWSFLSTFAFVLWHLESISKSNQRSLLDAILNILEIVSISDVDDSKLIADLNMNVYPEFNLFIMN